MSDECEGFGAEADYAGAEQAYADDMGRQGYAPRPDDAQLQPDMPAGAYAPQPYYGDAPAAYQQLDGQPAPQVPVYLQSTRYAQPTRVVVQRRVRAPQMAILPAAVGQTIHAQTPEAHAAYGQAGPEMVYDAPVEQSGGGAVAAFRGRAAEPTRVEGEAPAGTSRGMAIAMVIAVTIMLTGLSLLYLPEDKADAGVPVEIVFQDYVVEVVCGSRGAPFNLEISAPDKKAAMRAVIGELQGCRVRKVTSAAAAATAVPAS